MHARTPLPTPPARAHTRTHTRARTHAHTHTDACPCSLLGITLGVFGGLTSIDLGEFPSPEFYSAPSGPAQLAWWSFGFSGFSFIALPHFIQRIYAAKDQHALKVAWTVSSAGGWLVQSAGVVFGVVALDQLGPDRPSAFAPMVNAVMQTSAFGHVVGVLLFTATLGAIMSTADSLLIAISHLTAVEIVQPFLPTATTAQLSAMGKASSVISLSVAVGISFAMSDRALGYVARAQFGLSWQARAARALRAHGCARPRPRLSRPRSRPCRPSSSACSPTRRRTHGCLRSRRASAHVCASPSKCTTTAAQERTISPTQRSPRSARTSSASYSAR